MVTTAAGFGSLHVAREKATHSIKKQSGFSGIGKECFGGLGFFYVTFTPEGLFVRLSAQRRLPAGASRSSPAGILAGILIGILAECWCHLVRAGEMAGIFPRAALFSASCCEEPRASPFSLRPVVCHPPGAVTVPSSLPWQRRAGGSSPTLRFLGRLDRQRGMGTSGFSQLPPLLRNASALLVFINKGHTP